MSYQRPECPLPKLAIYLNSTSKTSKSSLQPDHTEKTIPKIHASLNKELNRRRIGSTTTGGSASAYMSPVSARLEAIEAIPVNETSSFWVALKRLFQPDSIKGLSRSGKSELYSLPDEEGELMRLLDDEEDQMIGVDRSLNGFERYEKLSGHDIHWISSTPSDPHGVKDLWSWLEGVWYADDNEQMHSDMPWCNAVESRNLYFQSLKLPFHSRLYSGIRGVYWGLMWSRGSYLDTLLDDFLSASAVLLHTGAIRSHVRATRQSRTNTFTRTWVK